MEEKKGLSYKDSGVDIDKANQTKEKIKKLVRETFNSNVLTDLGSFGGLFRVDFKKYDSPVLVSSVDGVGTKLKIAFMMDKHDTVGEDIVNHCINDILVQGAKPLFFMDYIAMGKHRQEVVVDIIKGLSKACKEASMVLLGGEMAEMPDMYKEGEYDLAGMIVGILDEKDFIDGKKMIKKGDVILGLASTGLHTNGYSLARKVLFEVAGYKVDTYLDKLGETVGEVLLRPHKSYLNSIFKVLEEGIKIHGLAHITGGGFWDNIPRVLPDNLNAYINKGSWDVLPIFKLIEEIGKVDFYDMYHTFNMGIGMVVFVDKKDADKTEEILKSMGEKVYIIGEVIEGEGKVVIE